MTQKRHANRNSKKNNRKDKHQERVDRGEKQIAEDKLITSEEFKLDWFKPTEKQKDIIISMCTNDLTCVQGVSGSGKSTTVIWQALQDMKRGLYKQLLFVKTCDESGDDPIGFLNGDKNSKIFSHLEAMRGIFYSFMSKEKLALEEKRERIRFDIPNFMKGATYDNTLILVDESQSLSPKTIKLVLERAGKNTRVVLLGDKAQCYSAKKRQNGFTDFINKITTVDEDTGERYSVESLMGYVNLPSSENMRSALSKRIVELYEGEE